MCEMVGAVDARALGESVGHLDPNETLAAENALELILDIGIWKARTILPRPAG